jgi:hypothetical protein
MGQPFAGHLRAVAHLVECFVVERGDGLQIQDDDRHLGALHHGQDGGAQGVGGDMQENDVHIGTTEGVSGLHRFFR